MLNLIINNNKRAHMNNTTNNTTNNTLTEDQFWFLASLPNDLRKWIAQYPAHANETAFAKGIPATPANHRIIDMIAKKVPLRRRYRGNSKPWYDRPTAFVHRQWADTIALYRK